ncbi:uncharacterized protein LOC117100855 isoform X2 [Anneissia japonica]|uniref:uncharacterized protein LOC117100855 isoform X2 n=1 Tax=Anneissia japonica TaxID=1529436 RepID=UPI001425862A|nr:uncharacterized protein LOC117100855 isoform X2 [Anneissia japonica]
MAQAREIRRFLTWKSADLKTFLRERNVPVGDEKHHELCEKAFWAEKLGLAVKPTDEEAERQIQRSRSEKLVLDGGIIRLPRPETLVNGWEDGPSSLPETSRDHLDSYIKAGLFMSGHVRALQYHGISMNISYCFVRGKVVKQQKTTESPYNTWIVLHKETGQVCTAECSCIVGIQATCKHVAGLLFAVVEAVEKGRNMTCTSQKQAWGAVPKKGKALHEPQFVRNIKVVGIREDVSKQTVENTRRYRSTFDPRLPIHRVGNAINEFNLDWLASITNGNCGILSHAKREPNVNAQLPDLSKCLSNETVETTVPVPTVLEVYDRLTKLKEHVSANSMLDMLKISQHQQQVLVKGTLNQASSTLWREQRKGRITSSVAGSNCSKYTCRIPVWCVW